MSEPEADVDSIIERLLEGKNSVYNTQYEAAGQASKCSWPSTKSAIYAQRVETSLSTSLFC